MKADIGVIGGTSIYSLMGEAKDTEVKTKYGDPSDKIGMLSIGGKQVAFVPRHGKKHTIPPQQVPYKANLQALKDMGVGRIISTGAVGSLRLDYRPGDFVLFDQFVNMTHGRADTIFDGNKVTHVGMGEPYCPEMRALAYEIATDAGIDVHKHGTIVVINGPRYSTKAESKMFSSMNIDVINMTQYPETALARELGICYLGIGIVTDYDSGLEDAEHKASSFKEQAAKFTENLDKLKGLMTKLIAQIPEKRSCNCAASLEGATNSL